MEDRLSLPASCDDATSQLFFSKGGGGDLSWPAATEIESKLTKQESLVALCDKYGMPKEFKPVCADTLRCRVCETPPQGSNALCIYSDALEAGLRFPLHDFYLKLLGHYRLAPSQLVPNAWKFMAAFVLRCKDAGVQPQVSAFSYFFSVRVHKRKDEPTGWHHFTPYAGWPRLFSGTLATKHDWKTRFFFLKSPERMPWKCPVAWGKAMMEDVGIVECTEVAIEKLMNMPCIDLHDYLRLHEPPVGDLTLLQQHSPTVPPIVKPEPAGASSAQALALTWPHQNHAALEAGARATSAADAAGEGDDSMRRKRRCPGPGPAAVTPQHSMVVRMQDEQRDNQIAQLKVKLRESEPKLRESQAVNDKFLEYLYKEKAENDLLKKKHAGLIEEQAAAVARVKAEHAAIITWLNEAHADDLARVKDAAEKKVQDVMTNVVRSLYSQLEGPQLKGNLAAAGMPEAQRTSTTS